MRGAAGRRRARARGWPLPRGCAPTPPPSFPLPATLTHTRTHKLARPLARARTAVFTLTNLDEEYWISFPTFYAHNLLLGQLRMEVGDQGVVLCKKTGLRAEVNFQQISMFGSATLNSVEGRVFAEGAGGKKIASIRGHWDKVLFITPEGGAEAPWLDLAATPVMPKLVLPLEAQGPWESRRLWRYCSEELQQRPEVNWAAVDREKGQLEEEQRVLPCHAKHGSAEYKDWQAKVFKPKVCVLGWPPSSLLPCLLLLLLLLTPLSLPLTATSHTAALSLPPPRSVTDPLTGKERQFHFFSGAEEGKALNVLSLSRSLADPRGGLGEAGAVPELVARTHAITLSARRCAERGGSGAAGAGAGAAASGAGAAAPGGAHAASSSSSSGGGGGGGGSGGSSGSQGSS